jgi:hypothetical protein
MRCGHNQHAGRQNAPPLALSFEEMTRKIGSFDEDAPQTVGYHRFDRWKNLVNHGKSHCQYAAPSGLPRAIATTPPIRISPPRISGIGISLTSKLGRFERLIVLHFATIKNKPFIFNNL